MRVVQLLPRRAFNEQNANQEMAALREADYEVIPIVAPWFDGAGIAWLRTIGARKAARLKPDIVSARDLDALGAGAKVKKHTGAKLVYDMHDPYSMIVEDDVPKWMLPRIEQHERKLLPKVDLVLASDGGRAAWVHKQWVKIGTGIDPAWDMRIVLNCRDPVVPYRPPPNTNTLCYTGTLHPNRFIREMFEAMQDIDGQLVIAGPRTPGSLYDWLEKWSKKVPSSVRFLGHITPGESLRVLQEADIAIQMADPASPINTLGPYNRLFDAMAVGRPIIGTVGTVNSDMAVGLGMGIPSAYDVESFEYAVSRLFDSRRELSKMSIAAYEACLKTYNWKSQAKVLVDAYRGLE